MGHMGTLAVLRQAQGAGKTTPDREMGAEGRRGSGASTCVVGTDEGAPWPQALDILSVTWHQRMFPA